MILVVDVGTSGIRALVLRPDGTTAHEHHERVLPDSPAPGLVEFDPTAIAEVARRLWGRVVEEAGSVDAVAVTAQRASTVVWDARSGAPLGPGLGWQDLRTVGRCLELRADGIPVAPNQTATKAEWLLANLDADVDPDQVRVGTVDSWIVWHLTGGAAHVTDLTNAGVTGLYDVARDCWDPALLDRLAIPPTAMPTVVDTHGELAEALEVAGSPSVAALIGDQQASLVGQGCVRAGDAKITFGTGAMLDLCLAEPPRPSAAGSLPGGTYPIVTRRAGDRTEFGLEAVMLAAGSAVEWLSDGLGIIDDPAASADLAATVEDADGVVFVPSLSGTGTPDWDHGARGLLVGVTRGTTRAHVVRAVLEGVAHRGADLVDAAEEATGESIVTVRVDGGMSANPVFVQALADATQRPVDVSAEREATALGAGLLAGVATGTWPTLEDAVSARRPPTTVEPHRMLDRGRFAEARSRAGGWVPSLSALDL